jgi:hypothetical protein
MKNAQTKTHKNPAFIYTAFAIKYTNYNSDFNMSNRYFKDE